jgi:hypothetical protein
MREAELVSELLVAQLHGMQDKKTSLDQYYADYDDEFKERAKCDKSFRAVVDIINAAFPDGLSTSEFRRAPMFYSLYCAVYHRRFGLPGQHAETPNKSPPAAELRALREAVDDLSDKVALAKEEKAVPRAYLTFVDACRAQTDNIKPRQIRFDTLYRKAFGAAR